MKNGKIAFLFPGQGAQYVGMGKDLLDTFPAARHTFEEAEDILKFNLSKIMLEGPIDVLTETRNSQVAIFVLSVATLRVIQQLYSLRPTFCAGLSLGEYTALFASDKASFPTALSTVYARGQYMNDACLSHPGTMAVVLGLEADAIQNAVNNLKLPHDIWIANYNCPGQIVISGTTRGIEAAKNALLNAGAKRVLPLQVHGAFHSGLMKPAEERLAPYLKEMPVQETPIQLIMNVCGHAVQEPNQIRQNLIKQVTSSVRWEQGVRYMAENGATHFIEIGCGKVLTGFNKRIGVTAPTISVETVAELKTLGTL